LQVFAEFDDDNGQRSPRYTTSTHEVLGVVDVQSRRVLSFKDAVRRGLIDLATGICHLATGVYHDRGRLVFPSDAIRQGLIKTKVLNDDSSAAWLVPSGRPVLPEELSAVVMVPQSADSSLELVPWTATPTTGDNKSPRHFRRTLSGWYLDL